MKKNGFTLIEMIMTIVIVGIIAGAFAVVIAGSMNSWLFLKNQKAMTLDATGAMRRMVREIKATRAGSITSFTSTRYVFTDTSGNTIDYQLSGTDLLRNGVALLNNLSPTTGLQFVYLTNTGAVAGAATAIKVVQITLLTQNGANQTRLQSSAGLRNQ